jgi:large subunit ribosomal protein L24
MSALHVKKGDKVIVLSGKDAGKQGEVLRVLVSQQRIFVSGVNMVTRHVRPTAQDAGGIVQREASIHASNVAHIDPKTGKPTRVGTKRLEDGRKVRYAKKSGEVIDQ